MKIHLPTNPTASFIARNPHLYTYTGAAATRLEAQQPVSDALTNQKGDRASVKKRIRQSTKPLLNKLEAEWLSMLGFMYPGIKIHAQSWRVKLANGVWFKVDFCASLSGQWTAWEVKGPKQGKNVDRGMLALKCAASQYPEVLWVLVWRDRGEWKTQHLIP
jgi:hypothetical protein